MTFRQSPRLGTSWNLASPTTLTAPSCPPTATATTPCPSPTTAVTTTRTAATTTKRTPGGTPTPAVVPTTTPRSPGSNAPNTLTTSSLTAPLCTTAPTRCCTLQPTPIDTGTRLSCVLQHHKMLYP